MASHSEVGHRARIYFHWITLLLVSAAYVIGVWHDGIDDPDVRLFWLDCHRAIGLAVLGLTTLRLAGRLILPFEPIHEQDKLLHQLARLADIGIFLGLLALPLLGWAESSAKMHKFKLFGARLPALVHHNPELGERLAQWHEWTAWALLGLIGLHSMAAIYHHFVLRDDMLTDMVRSRPSQA